MPISVNLDAALDKSYESTSLTDLANAPVSALAGVSEEDAEALRKAFNIKTIADLANHKFVHTAQAIVTLSQVAR